MKPYVLVAILAVTACTSISPRTLLHLSRFSLATVDPTNFTVDITVPDGAGVRRDSAKFVVAAKQTAEADEIREEFILQTATTPNAALRFRMNPDDGPRLKAIQAKAVAWEAADADAASGSISVFFGGCIYGDGPAADAPVSAFVRTSPDAPFLPLFTNMPWSDLTDELPVGAELPQCPPTDTLPR